METAPSHHRLAALCRSFRARPPAGWTSCGPATRPPGSGSSSTPASGCAGWPGRCCGATPRCSGGKRPTTCSWRRSPAPPRPGNRAARVPQALLQPGGDPDPARAASTWLAATAGPRESGSHHDTAASTDGDSTPQYDQADISGEPSDLAEWTEFHEQVEALPEEEREVFDLLLYQQLTHEQAAEVLGVTARTVRRRWQDARFRLQKGAPRRAAA